MNPLVSILMPAYNAAAYIQEAIACILNQTYASIELLIADDHSTDNTRAIVEAYAQRDKRVRVFPQAQNRGYLKTWNLLIAEAKGDFIAFQDADDYSDPTRLQQQVEFLLQHPEHGLIGCNFDYIVAGGKQSVSRSQYPLTDETIRKNIPDLVPFCGSAVMIRKTVYERIGGYRTYFDRIGAEDYDWILLIMEQFKVANLPEVLYYYRLSENSVTRTFTYQSRRKLFAFEMVKFLYRQRQQHGKDCLQENKPEELRAFEENLDRPFVHNQAHFYWYIAKKFFYEGDRKAAVRFLLRAIRHRPLQLSYYKDLWYYLRTRSGNES